MFSHALSLANPVGQGNEPPVPSLRRSPSFQQGREALGMPMDTCLRVSMWAKADRSRQQPAGKQTADSLARPRASQSGRL